MFEFIANLLCVLFTITGCLSLALVLSENFRKQFFAKIFTSCLFTGWLRSLFVEHRALWLKEFSKHKKPNSNERLVILEIGIGPGSNFQHYPDNCRLIAVDYNENFKTGLTNNLKNYPNIEFERYVNQSVENMTQIDDNCVDVVLVTHVFCSVPNVEKGLSEIKRVLKQGGKYYFFDHAAYEQDSGLYPFVQNLLTPLWKLMMGGCHLNRKLWIQYKNADFSQIQINHAYPGNVPFLFRPQIWGWAQK